MILFISIITHSPGRKFSFRPASFLKILALLDKASRPFAEMRFSATLEDKSIWYFNARFLTVPQDRAWALAEAVNRMNRDMMEMMLAMGSDIATLEAAFNEIGEALSESGFSPR